MAVPRYMGGSFVRNPGPGDFSLWPADPAIPRFSTVTISQSDPAIPLTGVLTFSLGAYSATIDLAAGARFLALTDKVPMVFMNSTAPITDQWQYILS